MRGKSIKLYIMGDIFKNLKSAELSNWTGKAFIGERKHSKIIKDYSELQVPGVYFLLSYNNEINQKSVYIGEADDISSRIDNHFTNKEWWDEFVIFISKDSNLTKAHVRYLEKRLYGICKENLTTLDVKNKVEPTGSKLPLSDVDEMETFLENLIFTLQNLNILEFTNLNEEVTENMVLVDEDTEFILNLTKDRVDGYNKILIAKMKLTQNGYRLLKGSYIEKEPRTSFKDHNYCKLRKKLEGEGYFKESAYEGCLETIKDIDFNSPSAAAAIVKNRAVNGRKEWKLQNGMNLDDYESQIND